MPRYGVNVQWLYTSTAAPRGPDERVLDAMAARGFDFLRLPTDYRLWSAGGAGHVGLPAPTYPVEYDGHWWDRDGLREFYRPRWELESLGVPVHVGEFGCYERTPDEVSRAWFAGLFAVYAEFGWGYALWEFEGPFGIVGHSRPGARFEELVEGPDARCLLVVGGPVRRSCVRGHGRLRSGALG